MAAPPSLESVAWYAGNAGEKTHPVGSRAADALGVHDLLGNAAEWVDAADDAPVVKGGAFADAAASVRCDARAAQTPAWNISDPQLPKSHWWLSDAPFVGLRLVREP
jgi:formylglycine-generating enzyme required for sulfatase activity